LEYLLQLHPSTTKAQKRIRRFGIQFVKVSDFIGSLLLGPIGKYPLNILAHFIFNIFLVPLLWIISRGWAPLTGSISDPGKLIGNFYGQDEEKRLDAVEKYYAWLMENTESTEEQTLPLIPLLNDRNEKIRKIAAKYLTGGLLPSWCFTYKVCK